MSDPRAPIFAAVRAVARPGVFNEEGSVLALDLLLDSFDVPRAGQRHTLARPAEFFAKVRTITGALDQVQVSTVNRLLDTAAAWPTSWIAYGLATAWHEARFKPQPEWGKGKGRPYARAGRHGQPQYGRGLVQLTWDDNYEWADKALGLNGSLLANFDRALEPGIAADILVRGMEEGAFAKDDAGRHSLRRYLPGPRGSLVQFTNARRIINGTDKASEIAGLAVKFQAALDAGGWR